MNIIELNSERSQILKATWLCDCAYRAHRGENPKCVYVSWKALLILDERFADYLFADVTDKSFTTGIEINGLAVILDLGLRGVTCYCR